MADYQSVMMGARYEIIGDETNTKRRYKIINLQVFLYANIINKIIEQIFELVGSDKKEMIIKYYKIILKIKI